MRGTAKFNFGGGTLDADGVVTDSSAAGGSGSTLPSVSWSSSLAMNLSGIGGPATVDTSGGNIGLAGELTGLGGLAKVGAGADSQRQQRLQRRHNGRRRHALCDQLRRPARRFELDRRLGGLRFPGDHCRPAGAVGGHADDPSSPRAGNPGTMGGWALECGYLLPHFKTEVQRGEGFNTHAEGVKLHSPASRTHPGVMNTMSSRTAKRCHSL